MFSQCVQGTLSAEPESSYSVSLPQLSQVTVAMQHAFGPVPHSPFAGLYNPYTRTYGDRFRTATDEAAKFVRPSDPNHRFHGYVPNARERDGLRRYA